MERHFENNIHVQQISVVSSSFKNKKKENNMEAPVNWSQEETELLIAVWSEEKIQHDLGESLRNEKVYRELSGRLAKVGVSRSAKQCREKIKKLKLEYRKIKKNSDGSGDKGKTFRWYDAMDTIMSESPVTTEDTEQSATMIPECPISDMETGKWSLFQFKKKKRSHIQLV